MTTTLSSARRRKARVLGALGLVLLIAGQTLTCIHLRPLSDGWYTIAWLGFFATADAWLASRTGASLVLDRSRDVAVMFFSSALVWWCFEIANALRLTNWSYSPSPDIPMWVQALRSTLAFSTLIPATWAAGLCALSLMSSDARHVSRRLPRRVGLSALSVGVALCVGALLVPRWTLPLGLAGALLCIDALNDLRARPSLLAALFRGNWRLPAAFFAGNVVAGVLGEWWNSRADPHWTYNVGIELGPRLFAMPLAGYLGYGLLAWVVFALHHAVRPQKKQTGTLDACHALSLSGLT